MANQALALPTSSSFSSKSRKPKSHVKWDSMVRIINYFKSFQQKVKIKNHTRNIGLKSSHGVSWTRRRLLGEGGYGSVFLAKRKAFVSKNNTLPSTMAVKSATLDQSSSLHREKFILDEFSSCPHIISCFGDEVTYTDSGEKIYNILLEFCSGLSLRSKIIATGFGLPESEVRNYTRDIVSGLAHIHSCGFVHADIKPGNILLASGKKKGYFVAKIADFGLSKDLYGTRLQEEGLFSVRGTDNYLSPELIMEGKLEYPADIWALGCTVVEMLCAKPAWDEKDSFTLLWKISKPDEYPMVPYDISSEAKDFLDKCFIRDPEKRWTALKLLEHSFLAVQ